MSTARRAINGLAAFLIVLALLLFVPAGTIRYWQAWVVLCLYLLAFGGMTLDLIRNAPDLLERRMKTGAGAETRPLQKVLQAINAVAFIAQPVVSALDHRYRWSRLPLAAVVAGDAAVVVGCYIIYRVFRANRHAAATVRVEEGQTLADTGPYAVVRHPMYTGGLLLIFGVSPALDSLWSLIAAGVLLITIVIRLLDEENMLVRDLPGYADYRTRVRYRLVPGIW